MSDLIKVASRWDLEVLQPGVHSTVVTQCASIRIRNTSDATALQIAPRGSSYRLSVAAGASWGIDMSDPREILESVIEVYTEQHDAAVIVERIFKRLQ